VTGPRILIVEDDEAIAAGLAMNLRLEGYDPEGVHDGQAALERILASPPALVLLDINLPHKDGLSVLRELREQGNHTPVLVLSARQGEYDKVAALRLGADDYVTKPFALAELMARVGAVLRRVRASVPVALPAHRVARFSEVEINLDTREVVRAGAQVKLTHLEFELLRWFLENPGRVYDRQDLLREVWGVRQSGSRRTVDNFMAQLRGKLERDPEAPRHFITVRGAGYRFDP
jgi:two-component system alkaline phosphatase synthesis response regulator PhoP